MTDQVGYEQLLEAVPVRNHSLRQERASGGEVTLYIPIRERWYMRGPVSWLVPLRKERGLRLDRLGTEVWKLCNGKRTTEEVIDGFAASHGAKFHEVRGAVMQYMRMLVRRGLIVLVGVKGGEVG